MQCVLCIDAFPLILGSSSEHCELACLASQASTLPCCLSVTDGHVYLHMVLYPLSFEVPPNRLLASSDELTLCLEALEQALWSLPLSVSHDFMSELNVFRSFTMCPQVWGKDT